MVAPLPPGRNNLPVAQASPIVVAYGRRGNYLVAAQQKRALPPQAQAFKERRQRKQAAAAITGGIAGAILLGPLGAVLVGIVAHGATKTIGRRNQARLERSIAAEENIAAAAFA